MKIMSPNSPSELLELAELIEYGAYMPDQSAFTEAAQRCRRMNSDDDHLLATVERICDRLAKTTDPHFDNSARACARMIRNHLSNRGNNEATNEI